MERLPSLKQIEKARRPNVWDLGNSVLYELCKSNFEHNSDDKVLAKAWLIGRSYAVALERRKKKDVINTNFYLDRVASAFKKSKIDLYLKELSSNNKISLENLSDVLKVHHYLTSILNKITEQDKRSFSSKYLHFHLPELFFIFDYRAMSALRHFISRVPNHLHTFSKLDSGVDKQYATFVCKSLELKMQIEKKYGLSLTNRQFDNLLIEISDKKSASKMIKHPTN